MTKDTQGQTAAVQVALRIRPLTERDRAQPRFANSANGDVLRAQDNHVQIVSQNKYFTYDHVFGTDTQQGDIFARLGQKPVQKFVEGYNVTMLAYGQTSSGKTYTMGTALHTDATDPEEEGIVPRAMALLFDILQQQQMEQASSSPASSVNSSNGKGLRPVSQIYQHNQPQKVMYRYSVKVSFVEIYNEELIDLLNSAHPSEKPPVTIREDTKGHIYWTGVREVAVHNTDDVLHFLQQGTENRATGSTDMNEKSSRSHAIFSVTLKQERWVPSSPQSSRSGSPMPSKLQQSKQQTRLSATARPNNANTNNEDGDWIITSSKFHFVDLAGSERLKRTAAEGDRRKEGININAGLLALGNVISALGDPSKKSTHVPYRDSKLTRLLQDSLGGSAMTLMIACVSPAESNLSETLNTLQYANRARNIKNKMEKNEVEEWMTTDNLDMLRSTISKLKNELRASKSSAPPASTNNQRHLIEADDFSSTGSSIANPDFDDLYHEQHVMIADLQQQVEELQGAAEFIKERNVVVEKELVRLHQEKVSPSNFDFQHLVEPVIEEYEKSISGLESQLAMIRAALSHSDQGFEEQQAKIEQLEIVIDSQEKTIDELRRRVGKLLERRLKDETYITELEKKLMVAVEETVNDREKLSELRGKILKLKEVDETTEQYIHDLESRLTASEAERLELKEKLNKLAISTKEESVEINEEKANTTQEHEKEVQELHRKLESSEKERQQLQNQIDQLLHTTAENETKEASVEANNSSMSEEMVQKDQRIRELESSLANLQHDHQDTLRELDEVLMRYQETLEITEGSSEMNKRATESEQEVQLLRESIQHLEQELDKVTRREMIFRQMTEDHNESAEVENTLRKLEISHGESSSNEATLVGENGQQLDNEYLLYSMDALQKKYQQLKTEMQLQNIRVQDDEDMNSDIITEIQPQYEAQMISYKRELKNSTRILKEVKKLKAHEVKSAHPAASSSLEHKILMKSIHGLDKQLTEQHEKLKLEAKRFSNDVLDMISLNSGLETELGILKQKQSEPKSIAEGFTLPNQIERNSSAGTHSNSSSLPSSPRARNSMIRPPTNYNGSVGSNSNRSSIVNLGSSEANTQQKQQGQNNNDLVSPSPSSTDLIKQYQRNHRALQTRLSLAKQDLKAHQTVMFALEHKFRTSEIALGTCNKRLEGVHSSVTDIEIEELMSKMDAMKIQLENGDPLDAKFASDAQ